MISSGLLLFLVLLLVLELRLARTIRFVDEQLQQTKRQLSEYRTFTKYLQRKDRATLGEKLGLVLRSLHFLRTYRWFLGRQQRAKVESYYMATKELTVFLEQFIPEYTKREVERHKDFFDGRPFDRDQNEAIVKRDIHNLIIAAAGSGKTRTLTARVAFTIRCGATPDKILALAYTNPAAEEMRGRLKNEYGIPDACVRTFHSLGRELAKLSPHFRRGVADSVSQRKFVADSVKRLTSEQRAFAMLLLYFAVESQTHESEREDFPLPEKYYEYLRNQKYITLNWKQVNSIAERDIANFLFLNRLKFEYETQASWADKSGDYRQYHPDFYLPEYGIWIEHWAVDRQGNVPPWFSGGQSSDPSTGYREGMEWKIDQFKKHGRMLIETYHYQWAEGTLIPELRRQLEEKRVELRELTLQEILDRIQKLIPRRDPLYELMFSFISKAKINGLTISDVTSKLAHGSWTRKQRAFASLMVPIWQEYEALLKENDMIDFNDMINYALQVARQQKSQLAGRYSHILIDEFQDITDPQLELIKCLLRNDENNTLFCVGDDTQNIFSFAGSNIYNILHFGKRFPYPEQTILSTNYRCPKNVVEASNSVASLNRSKIEKSVVSASEIQHPIRLIEKPSNDTRDYEVWELGRATELLKQIVDSKKPGEQIMVLARFNYPLRQLRLEFPDHETLGLRFLSIHRAKGTEADYVLLLSCISGRHGFPSEIMDQRVLDIVKGQENETDKLEEERRLFYVALTRCKNQLFLFTSRKARSQFVSEVEPHLTV